MHGTDDGLVRSALPLFLPSAHASRLVYTEMITCGALLHGDVERHLRFDRAEHPVALQLGGSDPAELARCARLGSEWGYDEINLNCGCPSERVLHGSFGACLMREPELVADCVRAMREAAGVPISVKHRLGIDRIEDYDFVRRFVETVAAAGCSIFIVHARNAVLKGLSPKENREVPPLRYAEVYRLKREFPELTDRDQRRRTGLAAIDSHLRPRRRRDARTRCVSRRLSARASRSPRIRRSEAVPSREQVVHAMHRYAARRVAARNASACHRATHARPVPRPLRRPPRGGGCSPMLTRSRATIPNLLTVALEAMQRAARERVRRPEGS